MTITSLGLNLDRTTAAGLPAGHAPILLVVLDTEEEFDWSGGFSPHNRSVTAIQRIPSLQKMFEDIGVRATYCIDYPVAATPASAQVFAAIASRGTAEIGAHLHPWVTPPETEVPSRFHSYGGNLEPALERAKLESLTRMIQQSVGVNALTFKAGRYGIASRTVDVLRDLGYRVDLSTAPAFNWSGDGGPDYSSYPNNPYWLAGDRKILEIPTTGGAYGPLWRIGKRLTPVDNVIPPPRRYVQGLLRRSGLVSRAMLTPEGFSLRELKQLADSLISRGERVLTLSFHSPSLDPGHTPFVRTESERLRFVDLIRSFAEWFASRHRGVFRTASEVHGILATADAPRTAHRLDVRT